MKLSYVILGATEIQKHNSYLNRLKIFHSPNSICFSAVVPCGGQASRNRFHYIIFSCFNTWPKHLSAFFFKIPVTNAGNAGECGHQNQEYVQAGEF